MDIGMASWAAHWEYSDYRISLAAAETGDIIAEADESAGLPDVDSFITVSATGITGDYMDVRVGQRLKIILVNAANVDDPGIAIYDNVRVTMEEKRYEFDDLVIFAQYWLEDNRP